MPGLKWRGILRLWFSNDVGAERAGIILNEVYLNRNTPLTGACFYERRVTNYVIAWRAGLLTKR